jgi:hypothetical protein
MTDTTNAYHAARDGYETALSPLRDILRHIKAGNVAEAEEHPFYPTAKAYIEAHPLPQDSLQYELYYLALFAEYVPFAVMDFLDECDTTFKAIIEDENILQIQEALLASDAGITEDDLNHLYGLISRAFMRIAPSSVFIQGMVDMMMLTLIGQDEESGEYILPRLLDGALIGTCTNAEGCRMTVGTEVVGNWGTCYPQEEGVITAIKPAEPGSDNKIASIQWKNEDGQLSSKITFHPVDTIHKPGWRSPNGSPLGVFLK